MSTPISRRSPCVENEWATLCEVVVGTAERMFAPPPGQVIPREYLPWWGKFLDSFLGRLRLGLAVPEWIRRRFERESLKLTEMLAARGVRVVRPDVVTPCPGEPPGLTQVFARDPIVVVGDTVIRCYQRLEVLRKELRGYDSLLEQLEARSVRVARVPPEESIYLEGGDVLVDLPNVFVGVGTRATNARGVEWLQRTLGTGVHVVPVPLTDPRAFHLDTCLCLIGPRLGIVYRGALVHPLPSPLDEYSLIEVDARTYRQVGVNVLCPGPQTVILQRRHRYTLGVALRERGIETIEMELRWHTLSGGGFRCATHPLSRAGGYGSSR